MSGQVNGQGHPGMPRTTGNSFAQPMPMEPLVVRVGRLEQENQIKGQLLDELRRRVAFLEAALGERLPEPNLVMDMDVPGPPPGLGRQY